MIKAGPEIATTQLSIYHWKCAFVASSRMYKRPPRVNDMAPTSSCFHDTISNERRISAGMLCMKSPIAISPTVLLGSKTSRENSIKNKTKRIPRIRGVQYINLFASIFRV